MALLPLILIALVQGITEFLPISSSGHLILLHHYFGEINDFQTRTIIDVSVHIGTLIAVLIYFRRDVKTLACGALLCSKRNFSAPSSRLSLYIALASLPVIITGLVIHILEPSWLLSLQLVAWTTLVFGVLLWWADQKTAQNKDLSAMNIKDALLIGCAQMLALLPGTSRSGITMTAGRALGYTRTDSARFSLLLAIIAISGAGALAGYDLIKAGSETLWRTAIIGATVSALTAWIAIALMMKWLEHASFTPFAIYRIILGLTLLGLIYSGALS